MRVFVLGLVLASMIPASAHAQPSDLRTEEARRLYELGVLAFEREQWPACADYFERSFTLVSRCSGLAGGSVSPLAGERAVSTVDADPGDHDGRSR